MPSATSQPQLTVNEIFLSIQGESTWAGLRCVFVRLTACDLRCTYCDTAYAFSEGKRRPLAEGAEECRSYLANVAANGPTPCWALLEFVRNDDPKHFASDAKTLIRLLAQANATKSI